MVELIPILVATAFAFYISLVDLREMRVPNRILFPGLLLSILTSLIVAIQLGNLNRFSLSILGGFLSVLIFFLIHLLNPSGLGMGDVKFAGLIGLALAWISFPIGLIGLAIAFIVSGIFAIARIAIFGRQPSAMIPFAPFMLVGLFFVELGLLI